MSPDPVVPPKVVLAARAVRAAADTVHPKVKVPAVVGVVITALLAALAIVGTAPEYAPYAAAAQAVVTTVAGWLAFQAE